MSVVGGRGRGIGRSRADRSFDARQAGDGRVLSFGRVSSGSLLIILSVCLSHRHSTFSTVCFHWLSCCPLLKPQMTSVH